MFIYRWRRRKGCVSADWERVREKRGVVSRLIFFKWDKEEKDDPIEIACLFAPLVHMPSSLWYPKWVEDWIWSIISSKLTSSKIFGPGIQRKSVNREENSPRFVIFEKLDPMDDEAYPYVLTELRSFSFICLKLMLILISISISLDFYSVFGNIFVFFFFIKTYNYI